MKIKEKKCEICGRIFHTSKPNKKYCSFSCREAAAKIRRMKWEDAHPDYNTKYMREYRRRLKVESETTYSKVKECIYPYKHGCRNCEYNALPEMFDGGCMLREQTRPAGANTP